jgi:hypothetical protein
MHCHVLLTRHSLDWLLNFCMRITRNYKQLGTFTVLHTGECASDGAKEFPTFLGTEPRISKLWMVTLLRYPGALKKPRCTESKIVGNLTPSFLYIIRESKCVCLFRGNCNSVEWEDCVWIMIWKDCGRKRSWLISVLTPWRHTGECMCSSTILTSVLDGGEWSDWRCGRFTSGEETTVHTE